MTYGLRVGINTDNFIIDQFELGYDYSQNVDYYEKHFEMFDADYGALLRGSDDIHRIYFNAIKEFEVSKSIKIYALLDIGVETFLEDKSKSDWFYSELKIS
jgi:OOP family OmpA-OmpF porin